MTTMTMRMLLSIFAVGCGSVDAADDPSSLPPADAGVDPGPDSGTDPVDEMPNPEIRFLGGAVLDERADQIDFSSGEPVHTHAGPAIALTETGCATIYKYAYLLDREPAFGRQTQANPLSMRFQAPNVAPLDPSASAYRVMGPADEVLQGWTTMTPDADGAFTVSLFRDDIATLDQPGENRVDVRFRDTDGTEKVATVCWTMHALAAPLILEAPIQAQVASVFGLTLPANSPIAPVVNGTSAPNITAMHVVQPTAEPTSISVDLTPPPTTFTKRVAEDVVRVPTTSTWSCTEGSCDGTPADPPDTSGSGTLHPTWTLRIVDDATGNVVCQGSAQLTCRLPGRAEDAPPRAFTLYVAATAMSELAPVAGAAERSLLGLSYFGLERYSFDACLASKTVTHTDNNGNVFTSWVCMTPARFTRITALDTATVSFGPAELRFASVTASSPDGEPMPYLASGVLTTAPMTWDLGDDDLPGSN